MKFFRPQITVSLAHRAMKATAFAMLILANGAPSDVSALPLLRTIDNPLPSIADNFGRNFMITNSGLILTGAHADVGEVPNAGIVYLINPDTGAVVFSMPNPEPETNVGYSPFSCAGDSTIIASAFLKPNGTAIDSGRVYVFSLSNGQHIQTLQNPTPESNDQFGYGVGMMGETAIVSSRADNASGPGTGSVYLFNTLTGALLRTISCPDPTGQDNFGYSVAGIGTDKVLVGCTGHDIGAADAGAAYLLNANTGAVIHKIVNPDPTPGAYFGFQVRAHGEDLLIGAPGNNKAYLYDGETGALIHRFENPDPKPGSVFGSSISSSGRYILIGNPHEPFTETKVGRAYLYSASGGHLLQIIENPTPMKEDRFGVSVGGANGKVVVSADQNTANNVPLTGSIHVFQEPPAAVCGDWNLYY